MKIAILGGTFNPLHTGHLFLAEEVLRLGGFDKILFIPTFMPAHKEVKEPVSAALRSKMIKETLSPYAEFMFDDCEIRREGISYMIDTLHEILPKYEFDNKPAIIIGDDLAEGFTGWKNTEEILSLAEIIVVRRNSSTPVLCNFPHRYLENKIFDLSSSEIRSRVRNNLPVRFLVPDKVYESIKKHNLYR
ncbi:MAG: nicotinate (nicotinamide) nucleotide adenylyltransferase [Spirochaetaceae bacterium]|nr:MAG: nicotinate (nicotinamide) nucleotide adenylyltransferase [Spirochaetaceae bacterium]